MGFGANVDQFYTLGEWPASVRRGLKQRTISISPLELLVPLAVRVATAGTQAQQHPGAAIVVHCDNEAAFEPVNSGRAHSKVMASALVILHSVEEAAGVRVRLEHIPGKENDIADLLSQNQEGRATKLLQEFGSPCRVAVPSEWGKWTECLIAVAARGRKAHAYVNAHRPWIRSAVAPIKGIWGDRPISHRRNQGNLG